MAVEQQHVIDAGDLTDADRAILDELREGARTKKYLIDQTGLHRNTVGNRLDVLEAGDVVQSLHDTTALYELVDDPRDDADQEDNVKELRARIAELEAQIESGREWAEATLEALERVDGEDAAENARATLAALEGDDG